MVQQIVPLPSAVILAPFSMITSFFERFSKEIEIQGQLFQKKNLIVREKTELFINDLQKLTTNLLPTETRESLHLKIAIDYYHASMYNYVIDHCNECLLLNEKNYFAFYTLSLAYGKMLEFKKAVEYSKKSLEYYHVLISIEKNPLFEQKIQKYLEKTTEQKTESIKKYFSSFFVDSGSPEDDYIESMKKLISFNDLCLFHISNLSYAGFYQNCVDFINENLQKSNQDVRFIYFLGVSHYYLHEIPKSIEYFELVLKKDFEREKTLMMLVMAYRRTIDEKASLYLNQLKDLNPNAVIPLCHLSILPEDLIFNIFTFLNTKSLIQIGSTSSFYSDTVYNSKILNNRVITLNDQILNPYNSLNEYKSNYQDYKINFCKILNSSFVSQCIVKLEYIYVNVFLKFVLLKMNNKKCIYLIPNKDVFGDNFEIGNFMNYVNSDKISKDDFEDYLKDDELFGCFFRETPNNLIH
jgi:tetratricopeptide (TPR) repeat protein